MDFVQSFLYMLTRGFLFLMWKLLIINAGKIGVLDYFKISLVEIAAQFNSCCQMFCIGLFIICCLSVICVNVYCLY